MPWTPAHPAFALPFLPLFRRPFAVACLAAGSIAPDLPYFLFVRLDGWGHAFPWLFAFGIPASLLAATVWMRVSEPALPIALPIKITSPLPTPIKKADFFPGCLAAGIGILTHVFVDAFTHQTGEVAKRVSWLQTEWFVAGTRLPTWQLLQYALTVIGLGTLFIFLRKQSRWRLDQAWRPNRQTGVFWLYTALFSCFVFLGIFCLRFPFPHLSVVIIGMVSAGTVGAMGASILMRQRRKRSSP